MEFKNKSDYLIISSEKHQISLFELEKNSWKLFSFFDSQHTQKISSIITIFDNLNNIQNLISFSFDKQIKIWALKQETKEFQLKHQGFFFFA